MIIHQPQPENQQSDQPPLKLTLPTTWHLITNPPIHYNQNTARCTIPPNNQPYLPSSALTCHTPIQGFCITTPTYYKPPSQPRITQLPDNTDPPNPIAHPRIPQPYTVENLPDPPLEDPFC